MGYLLGLDIGSSSVKASLLDIQSGAIVGSATSPQTELPILSPQPGFAEQHPDTWWTHVVAAVKSIAAISGKNLGDVAAIGISYQMHGLVLVNEQGAPLRNAIIWCDSRAVEIGADAFKGIGEEKALRHLLNSPGNFTASKAAWVKKNEPEIFAQVHKLMLPGDYIAYKLSGTITTTASGLSEGMLWDFRTKAVATMVLDYYGISSSLIPPIVDTFSVQGTVTTEVAKLLGLKEGTPISYRGGDQPNNALSLNVLNPGEFAATAGTSGVVYGVGNKPEYDVQSHVNTFAHVNYTPTQEYYGVLLCVNGTGILNSWIKRTCLSTDQGGLSYEEMNALAATAPVGSDGLCILPYGNGAERTLGNKNIHSSLHGLDFNRHTKAHLIRASQEGIVFALNYGLDIMRGMGMSVTAVRAGKANMFLSPIFGTAFATLAHATVELYNTDGAAGAARGAGIGAGIFTSFKDAFASLVKVGTLEPNKALAQQYADAYGNFVSLLSKNL